MSRNLLPTLIAAAAALTCQIASAQSNTMDPAVQDGASAPVSRASVKAQTKADARSRTLQPAGEAPAPLGAVDSGNKAGRSMATRGSTTSRAGVKADTKAEERSGMLQPAGEAPAPIGAADAGTKAGNSMAQRGSTTSRASVKSDTKAQARAGTLQPAGEAPQPAGEAPKK